MNFVGQGAVGIPNASSTQAIHPRNGLTADQARRRLQIFGENLPERSRKRRWWQDLIARLRNPLVLILLGAGLVSAATGELVGSSIIFVIVALSILMDFLQELRADLAVERLSASVSVSSEVLRGGKKITVPSRAIVPGDIVLLSAGDLVPADGVILDSRDFFVNQSMLTGESYPIEKTACQNKPGHIDKIVELDLTNLNHIFAGSSVVSGVARVEILKTGRKTILGGISGSLSKPRPETSFETGIRKFGMMIMRFTLLLVVFAFAVNVSFHRPVLQSLLFGVALAVGLTPELLPMVITVTLTGGALRMAKAKVIVKRLSAVQDLGSMEILCTDKTGTLTEGRIVLQKHVDVLGNDSRNVFKLAYINSYFETGIKSPLDDAILTHDKLDMSTWKKLDEVPFDFERKRVSVLAENGGERILAVKGANESILGCCTKYEREGKVLDLDVRSLHEIRMLFESLASNGFHILAIAYRPVEKTHEHAALTDETELVFAGFAAFLDPPKQSAGEAIAKLQEDNVEVKVLSGDHELVAQYVCDKLGFKITDCLTGVELNKLDDCVLQARVQSCNLFCRVNPAQKTRIISALKSRGKTVGFLGDGINDAPSLHCADVGISVDTAVDVAKQAADMVLLEHDLNVLHSGIRAGRRAFVNVQKYILMATSSNFGNMFSMALATVILPFLPMLPVQILLNNLLYDISELALPTDNVDEESLKKPARGDIEFIRKFMLTFGPISSVFDFVTFFVLLKILRADETLFHSGWFVESLVTQILVIFVIRTRRSCFASKPGTFLTILSLSIVILSGLLVFLPLHSALGFTPLPPSFFAVLAIIALIYLSFVELAKHFFYRTILKVDAAVR